MAKSVPLAEMSDEQLIAESQRIMAERADAEAAYKAAALEVQAEIDRRAAITPLRSRILSLTPEARAELLSTLEG